jgi:cytoskeletal protein CcmA (bactofilin family)
MFERHKDSKTETGGSPQQDNATSSAPNSTPISSVRTTAMIGPTIIIKGDITGDENLVIEGKVEGKVDLGSKDVTIGQTGRVRANIDASVIKIEGEVHGDMQGEEKVVISKTGKVQGNIIAPRVTLEDGAKFKGSIDMDPAGKGMSESPVASLKAAGKSTPGADAAGAGNNTANVKSV